MTALRDRATHLSLVQQPPVRLQPPRYDGRSAPSWICLALVVGAVIWAAAGFGVWLLWRHA